MSLSGYSGDTIITLTNSGAELTNQVMVFTIHRSVGVDTSTDLYVGSAGCETDYRDIRFTTDDEVTLCDYWLRTDSITESSAEVYVEVPTIAATSTTIIHMCYGNSGASAYSNGYDTFAFFDHFTGSAINETRWTPYGADSPVVADSFCVLTASTTDEICGIDTNTFTTTYPAVVIARVRPDHANTYDYNEDVHIGPNKSIYLSHGNAFFSTVEEGTEEFNLTGEISADSWHFIKCENCLSLSINGGTAHETVGETPYNNTIKPSFEATNSEGNVSRLDIDYVAVYAYQNTVNTGSEPAPVISFNDISLHSIEVTRIVQRGDTESTLYQFECTIRCQTDTYADYTALVALAGHLSKTKLYNGKYCVQTLGGTKGDLIIGSDTYTDCYIESISAAEATDSNQGVWRFIVSFVCDTNGITGGIPG